MLQIAFVVVVALLALVLAANVIGQSVGTTANRPRIVAAAAAIGVGLFGVFVATQGAGDLIPDEIEDGLFLGGGALITAAIAVVGAFRLSARR